MERKTVRILSALTIAVSVVAVLLSAKITPEEMDKVKSVGDETQADIFADSAVVDLDNTKTTEDMQTIEEAPPYGEERVWQNIAQGEEQIHVTADELQGNILGYSLLRYSPYPEDNMYYEKDMPYLVEEELVGRGIYISDYMCETEVFLGSLLKEVLADRGTVSDKNRPYFTEYALRQVEDTDWEALDADWDADLWTYDRYYSMHPLCGGGYQFSYYFYGDKEKTTGSETNLADIGLYVDRDGKICEIAITIDTVPVAENRIEIAILNNGLFEDDYIEPVIREGSPCREEMVWDFERHFDRFLNPDESYEQKNEGLLQSGNACSSAEAVADLFLHVMGNRGADVEKYEEQFAYYFSDFADTDWGVLEENWVADKAYDCFFIDRIAFSGYVGFQYYFYPDFAAMGVDEAMMVAIGCNVDCYDGMIGYNTVDIFPITEEACGEMRQKQEENKTLVVEKGTALAGEEKVNIPVMDRPVPYIPICAFDVDAVAAVHSGRKVLEELWGFTDTAQVGVYLGEKLLQDLANDQEESGWKGDGQYDCFRVNTNEAAGCLHLQYYFYPEKNGEAQTKARIMVVDVFLSEEGIEKMEVNEFCEGFL